MKLCIDAIWFIFMQKSACTVFPVNPHGAEKPLTGGCVENDRYQQIALGGPL